jgi:hypothetical protein
MNTKSIEAYPPEGFLESLGPGVLCDAKDKDGSWYNATIEKIFVEEKKDLYGGYRMVRKARVQFRIYSPFGKKVDSYGKFYGGWEERFDEDIILPTTFIQPLNSRACDRSLF